MEFPGDSSYTCIVKSKNKVEFEGEEHSLSSAGLKIMNEHLGFSWASLAGPLNWKYEGEVLKQLTVPPEIAEKLSDKAMKMVGYSASPNLGWVKGRDKDNLLVEGTSSPL